MATARKSFLGGVAVIDNNTKEVFDKAFELVKQGVVAAADTLRTYAPQLWAMVRRQVIIEGFEYLGGAILSIIGCVAIVYLIRRGYENREHFLSSGFDQIDTNMATGFVIVICTIVAVVFLVNAADLLFNPDYWTLKAVLALRQ